MWVCLRMRCACQAYCRYIFRYRVEKRVKLICEGNQGEPRRHLDSRDWAKRLNVTAKTVHRLVKETA